MFGSDCQETKDIVFVLDSSTSVGKVNFAHMLEYVKVLVEDLTAWRSDHRFSLITYSTDVTTIFSFNRYTQPKSMIDVILTTRSVQQSV